MSLPTLKKNLYGNWIMNAPDGIFMSRIDDKRAKWYLNRNLATLINENIIQLKFTPSGSGHANNLYYMSPKENRCVVCGTFEDLTRHHVVPHTYRKFFPNSFKSRSSHDIVVICNICHVKYENNHAIHLTKSIAKEMGFPILLGNTKNIISDQEKAKRLARIFLEREMEPHRKIELKGRIEKLINGKATDHDITLLASEKFETLKPLTPPLTKTHWSEVVRVLIENNSIPTFVRRWRQNFIDNAKPKFLPTGWSVEHEGEYRERIEK